MLVCSIESNARSTSHHAQPPLIVHGVEKMGGRVRASSPIVRHRAVREMTIHLLRMHDAPLSHKFEHKLRALSASTGPRQSPFCRNATIGSRMHERLKLRRHEAVVDEDVLVDIELGVAPLQIARAITLHAMAQNQILGAGRRADRVGLHKSKPVKSAFQRRWRKQTSRDRIAPQVVERDRHPQMLSKSRCLGFEKAFASGSDLGNRGTPPSPSVYWNVGFSGKLKSNLWGTIT